MADEANEWWANIIMVSFVGRNLTLVYDVWQKTTRSSLVTNYFCLSCLWAHFTLSQQRSESTTCFIGTFHSFKSKSKQNINHWEPKQLKVNTGTVWLHSETHCSFLLCRWWLWIIFQTLFQYWLKVTDNNDISPYTCKYSNWWMLGRNKRLLTWTDTWRGFQSQPAFWWQLLHSNHLLTCILGASMDLSLELPPTRFP